MSFILNLEAIQVFELRLHLKQHDNVSQNHAVLLARSGFGNTCLFYFGFSLNDVETARLTLRLIGIFFTLQQRGLRGKLHLYDYNWTGFK